MATEEENAEWERLCDDPDTQKTGQGEHLQIHVHVASQTQAIRGRTMMKGISGAFTLDSQQEMNDALANVANTGNGHTALSSNAVFGNMANHSK